MGGRGGFFARMKICVRWGGGAEGVTFRNELFAIHVRETAIIKFSFGGKTTSVDSVYAAKRPEGVAGQVEFGGRASREIFIFYLPT